MAKHRIAFTVTLTISEKASATLLAKMVRETLSKQEIWVAGPHGRKPVCIDKVTVTNIGEK